MMMMIYLDFGKYLFEKSLKEDSSKKDLKKNLDDFLAFCNFVIGK